MTKKKSKEKSSKHSKEQKAFIKAEKKKKKTAEKVQKIEKIENIARHADEIKRLNRVYGQIDGISKMLGDGRKLQDVLTQFKAVRSALLSIEQRVFENHVHSSVEDIVAAEKRKEREAKIEELKTLYKAA